MHTKQIMTFGLNESEIAYIQRNLPQKECDILETDVVTDIIAISAFAVIVKIDEMRKLDVELLYDYYGEIAPFS